ncbi:MAG: AAA family ATPase, partial [Planctomycetota bacterium]
MSSNDPERRPRSIEVTGAREHNLRGAEPGSGLDVAIERGAWTAVTGPSGSGKTSLVFDVLVREGARRYLGSQSAKALQFFGKLGRPDVKRVAGLPAPIAVARRSVTNDPRSTVGTQSGALDLLRLLFARAAQHPSGAQLTRSHFSFNTSTGACEACGGIGLEDRVDPDRVVADASRSIREGALRPTLPNGYTVYSQVTLEVMDTICRAHGFDVDTPWNALTDEQRHVVLYGTKRLKVPFGKHSLESRMKWEGITARPREEGYYRGIVPVIEETLLRNRNENVLRYARSVPCSVCGGSRLGALGREARLDGGASLPELLALSTAELVEALPGVSTSPVLEALLESLGAILARMVRLGLGHLAQARGAATLSGGEAQRLRLAAHLASGLGGALFALDEPTLGLHPEARDGLREVLDELVAAGNTLVVVEHDPGFVAFADRALALGPGAGPDGGRVVLDAARAADALAVPERPARRPSEHRGDLVRLSGATLHNLREAELAVPAGAFTAVVGPSGAGKSSLVFGTLLPALTDADSGPFASLWTAEDARVLAVDARPMGRSSRSTPATWSGVFDHVRKRFAATDAAKRAGLGAGAFSFNGKAGRCEECEGLGHVKIGLHLYEDSARTCPACGGARYRPEVLDVRLDGRTVADVLALSVDGALAAFEGDPKIAPTLEAMAQLGLGYLKLGAPSTVLSSGEAQRIRLATLLAAPKRGGSLYCFDEPDRGLHPADLARLVEAFDRLVAAGDTVLAITHSPQLWAAADRIVEVRDGVARERSFGDVAPPPTGRPERAARPSAPDAIQVRGARTHSLRGVDVRIPHGGVTAVVGPSGSGKSSLAFDTIAAEAWRRYAETLPFQVRRFIARMPRPEFDALDGLTPTVTLRQNAAA